MNTTGSWYRIVSIVLGIVLLATGSLKVYSTLLANLEFSPTDRSQLFQLVLGGAELLWGGWLVLGLTPRATRAATLILFVMLSNFALLQIVRGAPSCGCLGSITLAPWVALVFDGLAILALLLSDPGEGGVASTWTQRGMAIWAGMVALALAGLGGRTVFPSRDVATAALTPEQQTLLERVIVDIEANSATYRTLTFELSEVNYNHQVKKAETIQQKLPGGGSAMYKVSPKDELLNRYTIAGPNIRFDVVRDGGVGEIQVTTDQHWTQYLPSGAGRVWIRSPETPLFPGVVALDRSMWGLRIPLAFPRDWLGTIQVTDVRETPEGIVVEGESVPSAPRRLRMVAVFSPAHRHLPVRYEQWNADGTIDRTMDVTYQKLPERDGWILKNYQLALWPTGMTTVSDPSTAPFTTMIQLRDGLQVDREFPANPFVLTYPAGTRVHDSIRPGGMVTPLQEAVIGSDAALAATPTYSQAPLATTPTRQLAWWPFLVWNLSLMLLGYVLFSRLT